MSELDSVLRPYTSHKKVRAAEITSVGEIVDGARTCAITLASTLTIDVEAKVFARYVPVPGDYLVIYEDGYKSISPRKAFLEGYKADGESFSDIKQGIKNAKANPHKA